MQTAPAVPRKVLLSAEVHDAHGLQLGLQQAFVTAAPALPDPASYLKFRWDHALDNRALVAGSCEHTVLIAQVAFD